MFRRFAAAVLSLALLAPAAMATPPKFAVDAQNPPPATPLNVYNRFELMPVAMSADIASHKGNAVARQYLQVDVDERIPKLVAPWNAQAVEGAPRTLVVQPEVTQIRFITGGKRLFTGSFGGNSWALLRMRLTDKETGAVVAEPQFYQRAFAMAAGYSLGAADKLMLARLSDMAAGYLKSNFEAPVGSPITRTPGAMD